ncbi:acyl-CoA thioesterase [Deinococcus yunweiensis]|uniref:acyl-CoA thioesterase n=1 Tax=Deinococcus yunweiensis TaxID=367282 RepID=UPI00398F8D12
MSELPEAHADWDALIPARRFEVRLTVGPEDLDELSHVNNVVYLTWCERVARAHAASLGMDTPALAALGAVPVARQHRITYHVPALRGDLVRVRTLLTESAGLRSVRVYTIDRVNDGDPPQGVRLAECRTDWVWVDPVSGRPKRTPAKVMERFGFAVR